MSLAKKMQQGGTTPNLYSFYGKQYDYNDLAQAADQGLNEYLTTLKRGEKDSDDFRTAYANIMAGIKDGSITFDNGQFHDSKGRYTNSDKKNKDYYGLIANYIYGKMGKSNVYQAPKDPSKIEWGDGSVKTALMRQLFNSDNGNVEDFLELDAEKNGVRSIANRSTYLSNALQSVADNWDNTFQGYQDADKSRYVPLLVNAAKALRDGTIDPGDYLALSKAVGGMDFREMMATGTPTVQEQPAQQVQDAPVQQPQIKTKHASLFDNSYDANTMSRMTSIMVKIPSKGLINILRNSFYNRYYRFGSDPKISKIFGSSNISSKAGVTATLNALQAQGVLQNADPNNPNLYYIPGLRTKKGTGWVWDKATNTVTEMLLDNIPYAKSRMMQVQAHRNGGILFAQQGTKLPWYSGINDFDVNKFSSNWGNTLYGINNKGVYGSSYGNSGRGMNDSRYKTDSNYSDYTQKGKSYASEVEGQQYYKDFTNSLLSSAQEYANAQDKSSFNDDNNVFLKWAHLVDKGLPSNSTSTFFDQNGNLRTSWKVTNKDSYMRDPREAITNLSDYIRSIRNDQLLANRHNDLMKEGTRYFYTDTNGVKHWVDPEIAKSGKYQVSSNGIKSVDGITNWTDYELTGVTPNNPNSNTPDQNNGSAINPTQQPESKPNWFQQNGLKLAQDIAPLAVGAGRLFDSLHTNNKVADVVRRSIKPVLKNTYELYSPVTGAFSEMQLRNRQAADVRRQAAQPYTSDASLNAARSLDANRQATDLQYQGFLADDKEILRTKQEALKRQEDNIARRTDTANFNRASINQANRELAQVEAGRLKSNWQSRDNFLSGIESDLKEQATYNKLLRRQEDYDAKSRNLQLDLKPVRDKQALDQQYLSKYYERKGQDLTTDFNSKLANFYAVHGEDADYTGQEFYKDYIKKYRDLQDASMRDFYQMSQYQDNQLRNTYNTIYNNQRSNAYSNPFESSINPDYTNQNWYKILNGIRSNKIGGKLSLKTQCLLNKIVK